MDKKRILVTGGTGYIGSHTVTELVKAGYEVLLIDNLSNSYLGVLQRLEEISGASIAFKRLDLRDRRETLKLFKEESIDGVIHFAALKSVSDSVSRPQDYYSNNIGSLLNLCDAMIESDVRSLVFSSSCTVYGQPDSSPVDESAPFKPAASPYGKTKQVSEQILDDITHIKELEAVSLRYFNPIGAHPSARIGELPIGIPTNLIPYLTQSAAGLRDELIVFGNDYDTPDGTAIRDYIHVMDLAKAHVAALEYIDLNPGLQNKAFNLGTGTGYSVLEVINTFERVTGVAPPWKFGSRRSGDIEKIWADPGKANRELGWKAELGLDIMMQSAWEWQLSHGKEPIS